jgi:hypothetical protein
MFLTGPWTSLKYSNTSDFIIGITDAIFLLQVSFLEGVCLFFCYLKPITSFSTKDGRISCPGCFFTVAFNLFNRLALKSCLVFKNLCKFLQSSLALHPMASQLALHLCLLMHSWLSTRCPHLWHNIWQKYPNNWYGYGLPQAANVCGSAALVLQPFLNTHHIHT